MASKSRPRGMWRGGGGSGVESTAPDCDDEPRPPPRLLLLLLVLSRPPLDLVLVSEFVPEPAGPLNVPRPRRWTSLEAFLESGSRWLLLLVLFRDVGVGIGVDSDVPVVGSVDSSLFWRR